MLARIAAYIDDRREVDGARVHAFRSDPRPNPAQLQNPSQVSIEGVPLKEVMIDAICGAGFPNTVFAVWAEGNGLAKQSGNQWNEGWSWDRGRLAILELDALFAIYGRAKRL